MRQKLTCRPYQSEEDFWKMRAFLRQVFLMNNRLQPSWHVARLDYSRWHVALNCAKVRFEDTVTLWERGDQITAVLMPDGGPGEAHFLVDPILRTAKLEEEMLQTAQERLAFAEPDGSLRLTVWCPAVYLQRQTLLHRYGYKKGQDIEYQWQRDLDAPIPDAPLAAGYTIRSLGDGLELLERCYASGLGFHAGDIRVAVDNRTDPQWYRNIQTAPLYRRDLDLVAVSPEGAIAAFCTLWFDDVTRSAYFEPVATVPEHQRRGLGKALMTEGLRRLQRMGATRVFVSGYSPAANALYRSVMAPVHELYEPWENRWRS